MNGNRITPQRINQLESNEVFVFGSNLRGIHGGGAARQAMHAWGAKYGEGIGHFGQTYAIPTMETAGGRKLALSEIGKYVDEFIQYAKSHGELTFYVTEIGCGIAGFDPGEIGPLFEKANNIKNVYLPERFWEELFH